MSEQPHGHHPEADLTRYIRETTQNIGGSYGYLLEAFWNSMVAGATQFWVVRKAGRGQMKELWFCDNGRGMAPGKQQNSFLDLALSPYRNSGHNVRSQHGYGRLAYLRKFVTCEAITITPDLVKEGIANRIVFEVDDLLRQYGSRNPKLFEWEQIREAETSMLLPEGATTGTCIKLIGPTDTFPTLSSIRKGLGTRLPPMMADLVRVYDGKDFYELDKRELFDDELLLSRTEEGRADVGMVDIQLYLPKHSTRDDDLQFGWVNQDDGYCHQEYFCSWRGFAQNCPPELWDEDLDVLSQVRLGHILMTELMNFRAGDSNSFKSEFYGSDMFRKMVHYLKMHVLPALHQKFSTMESAETEKEKADMQEFFEEMIGRRKKTISRRPDPHILQVKPAAVELAYGESIDLEAFVRSQDIGQILWKMSEDLGHLKPRIGKAVNYKAPRKRCDVVVTAYSEADPSISFDVPIMVVPQKALRITPANAVIPPGHRRELKAANCEDWTDARQAEMDLQWKLDPSDRHGAFVVEIGGEERLRDTVRGKTVIYQAGEEECAEGFEISLRVLGTKQEVTSRISVLSRPLVEPVVGEGAVDDNSTERVLELEGIKYRLQIFGIGDGSQGVVEIMPSSRGGTSTIVFDLDHPALEPVAKNKTARKQMLWTYFLLEHLSTWHPDMNMVDVSKRLAEMQAEINREVAARNS